MAFQRLAVGSDKLDAAHGIKDPVRKGPDQRAGFNVAAHEPLARTQDTDSGIIRALYVIRA
jgi:hypothetical protein